MLHVIPVSKAPPGSHGGGFGVQGGQGWALGAGRWAPGLLGAALWHVAWGEAGLKARGGRKGHKGVACALRAEPGALFQPRMPPHPCHL